MWLIFTAVAATAGTATGARAEPPELEPYGFVRLDAIFDDSQFQDAQFPFFVLPEPDGAEDDAELTIHPRLTRLGVAVVPWQLADGVTGGGKIEIDFQNGGKESRSLIRMRHAYMEIEGAGVQVLAGQTWDLISPLYPAANNDGMMWNVGNLGDRRPQVRLSTTGLSAIRAAVAVSQPNAVDAQDLDMDGKLDGFDAAVPLVQALIEAELGGVIGGVWSHWGQEDAFGETFTTSSVGGHVKVPIGTYWVQGEAFYGQNLSDVRGGIGQAVNPTTLDEVRSAGGWIEGGGWIAPAYMIAAGFALDAPDEDDLEPGMRERNWALYLVQRVKLWETVQLGVEYLYWNTDYVDADSGTANRVNIHATLPF